ncbi:hypothetical protein CXG81DRAFT_13811, partial [Caulochytrium protostelioides]
YKNKIRRLLQTQTRRLIVNLNDLRAYNRQYAEGVVREPVEYLPAFDQALKDTALAMADHASAQSLSILPWSIGIEGSFGQNFVEPRELLSRFMGQMISFEGIVTKCSLVRPKVMQSVHYCAAKDEFLARNYRDGTALNQNLPTTSSVYPKQDDDGNPLRTEFGLSTYRDFQTISAQEMPERAVTGAMPHPVDIILEDDLVDVAKPGDRVRVTGVWRPINKAGAVSNGTFRTVVLANHVRLLGKEAQQPKVSESDVREIKKIGKKADVFSVLARSLAPSIYGHEYIKKAVLLMLLGGIEKNLPNGTHLRGDINMLLIGDPSTAKSQMLRFVLNTAPLAIATTGRGSSGVGLTAAVTTDRETGERTLEAGAMVLADRGVVCIDEFDKMSDVDRVAIHEVMEQQTVTIAKAGIHTTLNARCSVFAAANPAFGQYVDSKEPWKNIALPDSLLSRFDLVFVVLDTLDDAFNRAISDHVLRLHRYIPAGLEEGQPINDTTLRLLRQQQTGADPTDTTADAEGDAAPRVYEKFNRLLHVGLAAEMDQARAAQRSGSGRGRGSRRAADFKMLTFDFLKKYIHYAKTRVRPNLTTEASNYISEKYVELRTKDEGLIMTDSTMPVTARTLETLIRLATAHAKLRLSQDVELEDAEVAYEMLTFALFKEMQVKAPRAAKKARVADADHESDSDAEDAEEAGTDTEMADTGDHASAGRGSSRLASRLGTHSSQNSPSRADRDATRPAEAEDPFDLHDAAAAISDLQQLAAAATGTSVPASTSAAAATGLSGPRFDQFKRDVAHLKMASDAAESLTLAEVCAQLPSSWTADEVRDGLKRLSDANQSVWFQEDDDSVMWI